MLKAHFHKPLCPSWPNTKNTQGEEATRIFVSYIAGLLTLVLAVVTVLGIIGAPIVLWITAPGFANTPERFDLTVHLLRITFPYIFSDFAGVISGRHTQHLEPLFRARVCADLAECLANLFLPW